MNRKLFIPFITLLTITSCSNDNALTDRFFCYNTYVEIKMFEGENKDISNLKEMFLLYDKLSDNYQARDLTNIYTINRSNKEIQIDEKLYELLETSINVNVEGASYFNPLCGTLSKKWKNSLNSGEILSKSAINIELEKMNNTYINLNNNSYVFKDGEAEIDLGGIIKGYVLDEAKSYLDSLNYKNYIINAGNSSILLGEKNTKDGLFNIRIDDLNNVYLKLKNCFVSTSSNSIQGKVIDGIKYSHIVNPISGEAISENDAVIVISDKGYYGDAMSTSLMMNTIDEIKQIEMEHDIKVIAIKDNKIVYKNSEIEVFTR